MERNFENHHGLEYPELNPPLEHTEKHLMSSITEALYSKFKECFAENTLNFHVKLQFPDIHKNSVDIFCNWGEKSSELRWHPDITQNKKETFGFLIDMAIGRFNELVDIYTEGTPILIMGGDEGVKIRD